MGKTYEQTVTQFRNSVRDAIVRRPDLPYRQIAEQFGISEVTVCAIAAKCGVGRIKTGPKPRWLKQVQNEDRTNG